MLVVLTILVFLRAYVRSVCPRGQPTLRIDR